MINTVNGVVNVSLWFECTYMQLANLNKNQVCFS